MSDILCARKDEALVANPARLLKAALYHASLGLEVLPLKPGEKIPHSGLVPHGVKDATTDLGTIRDWWGRCPTANLGLKAGDMLLILDVDTKSGDGLADLARMQDELGALPPTPYAITPSGGRHLFFHAPDYPVIATTGLVFGGVKTSIDIRAGNSYVAAAPSVVGGRAYRFPVREAYLRRNEAGVLNVATLPDNWVAILPSRDYTGIVAPTTPIIPSAYNGSPDVVERCARYVATMDSCVASQGGDTQLYRVCCTIFHDFALAVSEGMRILEAFNARCQPPWSEYRLLYKVKEAMRSDNKDKPRGWRLERNQT